MGVVGQGNGCGSITKVTCSSTVSHLIFQHTKCFGNTTPLSRHIQSMDSLIATEAKMLLRSLRLQTSC